MSLKGKVALVTGSTSGIGQGIAEALAAEGASIMLNGFGDAGENRGICGPRSSSGSASRRSTAAPTSAKASRSRRWSRKPRRPWAHWIFWSTTPASSSPRAVEEFPDDKWDQIIAINMSGVFHGMKAAIPGMKAKGWGRIINIASAHGLVASPFKVAYVAAKHGVLGMTKVAAIELANTGVTVNAICPGWVLTPLVEKQLEDRAKETGTTVEQETHAFVTEKQPMAQFSTPEEIGALAVFLCSDAAKTITGAPLSIDGGWVAQ